MVYDLIVVGLGAIGSATLYQASKSSHKKILGIDQYDPPHDLGSSHGETRIFRLANAEGDHYTTLALRSLELWKAIDNLSIDNYPAIYTQTGGVIIANQTSSNVVKNTYNMALRHQIPHQILGDQDLKNHYEPLLKFNQDMIGYHEKTMGYLRPEVAIRKQLSLALDNQASIHTNETVLHYNLLDKGTLQVTTNKRVYETSHLIISAGPWIKNLAPKKVADQFNIYRQISCWFRLSEDEISGYKDRQTPIFIIDNDDDKLAIFPVLDDQNTIKIITITKDEPTTPETTSRDVRSDEIKWIYDHYVKRYLHGVTSECVKAETCLYTQTKDNAFVIDYLPNFNKQVIVASPCSGHGFKHSTAIGESLAQIIFNKHNDIKASAIVSATLTCDFELRSHEQVNVAETMAEANINVIDLFGS